MSHWFVATDTAGHSFKIRRIQIDQIVSSKEREQLREDLRKLAARLPALRGRFFEQFVGLEEGSEGLDLVRVWVETRDFADRQLSPERGLATGELAEVAAALDEAHGLGFVHGALKPSVILWTGDHVVVSEFLVDRALYRFAVETDPFGEARFYESPEQIQERGESGTSDQFALAAIAYLWLTGQRPFEADNVPTLHYRICKEPPQSPQKLNPRLSETASEALLRGLAKRPEDRFPTCSAFVAALARAQGLEIPRVLATAVEARGLPQKDPVIAPPLGTATVPTTRKETAEPVAAEPVHAEPFPVPSFGRARNATTRRRQTTEIRKSSAGRKLTGAFLAGLLAAGGIWLWWARTPTPLPWQGATDNVPLLSESELKAPDAANLERGLAPPAGERGTKAANSSVTRTDGTAQLRTDQSSGARPRSGGTTSSANATASPGRGAGDRGRSSTSTFATTGKVATAISHASQTDGARSIGAPAAPPVQRPGPSEIHMVSSPPGARMILDGDPSRTCTAPCSVDAAAGRHTLTATIPGYAVARRIFNMPDDQEISVDLQPNAGLLLVTSEPSGAIVTIDGRDAGRTPASLRLSAGQHHLVLILSGNLRAEDTVNISPEQLTSRTYRW